MSFANKSLAAHYDEHPGEKFPIGGGVIDPVITGVYAEFR